MEDSRHNIWVGTNTGGLNMLDRKTKKFINYRHDPKNKNSLSKQSALQTIFEDSKREYLDRNSGSGISILNPETQTFTIYKADNTKKEQPFR
jgi:hypothetical protein